MNKKRLLAGMLTGVMALIMTGCGAQSTAQEDSAAADNASVSDTEGYTVAYVNLADSDVNCRVTKEYFDLYSKDYPGMNVSYYDADSKIEKMVFSIESAIAEKADVIIALPLDADALAPAVIQANEQGIPFIAFRADINGGEYTYVGSRDYDAGVLQGEYLAEHLPENSKVLYLAGTAGMTNANDRRNGLADVLTEKRPDVTIISDQDGKYLRDEGMKIMEDWMQSFSDFDAVAAGNDEMALGALEALKAAQKLDGVLVLGIDGNSDALEAIANGDMAMSAYQNSDAQAKACAEVAAKLAAGEAVESVNIPFESVVIDNVASYQ